MPADAAVGLVSSEGSCPVQGGLGPMGLDSDHGFTLDVGWSGVVLLG